jgi:hypothetical protein
MALRAFHLTDLISVQTYTCVENETWTVLFCGEGPRSRCYGRTAALKAYCATL